VTSGSLTFLAGATTQTISVPVLGDVLDENDESFNVDLSGAVDATISDALGIGTISDDDAMPSLSIGDVSVVEGNAGTVNAVFTVTLSTASGRTVSVDYATQNPERRPLPPLASTMPPRAAHSRSLPAR